MDFINKIIANTDRSELALFATVIQAALALAVDFGVKLSTQQQTDILVFEGSLAALAAAYLIHRGSKSA